MKTAIKLVLIYLGIQILSGLLVTIPTVLYNVAKGNPLDGSPAYLSMALTMVISFILMGVYLWKAGYIRTDKRAWSPVSVVYLSFTTLACLTSIFIIEYVQTLMPALPNWLEGSFEDLQSGWLGILCIAVLGPILEELMFRGAITGALLKKYSPTKAIILSALVFGIFHINPAQVVVGILIGLLLGWIYYKTASLIPCILVHILNNSLSVYLSLKYPDTAYIRDLFTGDTYYIVLTGAIIIFVGSILWMRRTTVPFLWKGKDQKEIQA